MDHYVCAVGAAHGHVQHAGEAQCGDRNDKDVRLAKGCRRYFMWPRPEQPVDLDALLLVGNWISFVVYLFTVFFEMSAVYGPRPGVGMSFAEVMAHQVDAFRCYFGLPIQTAFPDECTPGAWLSVTAFIVQFVFFATLSAMVTARVSAVFQLLAAALVYPLTAVFGQFTAILGPAASEMKWYTGVSIPFVLVAIVVFCARDLIAMVPNDNVCSRAW